MKWGRAPQPLTLTGAGSPSVIAGSRDTVGKPSGAREVSCSRSRGPKSACRGEQGRVTGPRTPPGARLPQDTQRPPSGGPARSGPPAEKAEPSLRGLTSEPRTGLGPCSLSLGELHPDAGVLPLLGEESEGRGDREVQLEARCGQEGRAGPLVQGIQDNPSPAGSLCFLLSSHKGQKAGCRESPLSLDTFFLTGSFWVDAGLAKRARAALSVPSVCRIHPA